MVFKDSFQQIPKHLFEEFFDELKWDVLVRVESAKTTPELEAIQHQCKAITNLKEKLKNLLTL